MPKSCRRVPAVMVVGLLVIGLSCAPEKPERRQKGSVENAAQGLRTQPSKSPDPPASAAIAVSPTLSEGLGQLWARTPKGCLVVETAGSVLFEAGGGSALEPASTIKILTAAAALNALGESTRFRTAVTASSKPVRGTIRGNLWLVGGGDPVLATNAWAANYTSGQPYTSLDELADRVAAAGVRIVEGSVVGDETRYDSLRYVESWPDRFAKSGEIGPLSALAVNDGFSTWGHPGVPFDNPPVDAAAVFQTLLETRGIRILEGPLRGKSSRTSVEVASVESPDVKDIVSAMLRDSDNGTAEMLIKEIGLRGSGAGSTSAGTAEVTKMLFEEGRPAGGLDLRDGSGLSPLNRVSCRLIASILRDAVPSLVTALPVAGRTGTLSERFVGTSAAGKLRAKTGSLDGVAALAGYADNRAGTTLTFAYLANGLPRTTTARSLQDLLGTVLASDTSGPA